MFFFLILFPFFMAPVCLLASRKGASARNLTLCAACLVEFAAAVLLACVPHHYASLLAENQLWDLEVSKDASGKKTMKWVSVATFKSGSTVAPKHAAYADFGTPGKTAADFDFKHLDGKPEFEAQTEESEEEGDTEQRKGCGESLLLAEGVICAKRPQQYRGDGEIGEVLPGDEHGR